MLIAPFLSNPWVFKTFFPTDTHFTEILKSQDLYNAYIYNI